MIIDTLLWYKTWQLGGYHHTLVKQKLLRKRKSAHRFFWCRQGDPKSFTLTIPWNLARSVKVILETLHVNTAQIGNEWDCWESSAQSEGRDMCRTVAIRGGFNGMLLLSAKDSRSLVWWEDTLWVAIRRTIWRPGYSVWSDGRISAFCCQGLVATASVRSKSPVKKILWMCVVRGRNLEGRHHCRRHWGIGTDRRHLNSTKKTQCQGSVDVNKKWKLRVPSRRWNSQNFWRRSRSENIRLYLEHPRPRRTRCSSRKIRSVIFTHDNKTHHGMMVKPKVIFGLSQKILFTVITWNPESNCTWRLKNHFLFHWNTLTIPEQPTRLWMRCRRKTFKITRQKWKKRNSDRLQEIQCVEWETTWWM